MSFSFETIIDWSEAPEWATCCAEDFRHGWWWLEFVPTAVDQSSNVSKITQGRVSPTGTPKYFQAKTLIQRPK